MAKKTPKEVDSIQNKIRIAQEAVSRMTDESLKTIAFQTVLQSLLSSPHPPESPSGQSTAIPIVPSIERKKGKQKNPKGPKGRVEELITQGFFAQKRTLNDIKQELEKHGWFHRAEDLNPTVLRLLQEKMLRRIKEPEKEGGKLIWRYSNW